jgi:hypothetical protein
MSWKSDRQQDKESRTRLPRGLRGISGGIAVLVLALAGLVPSILSAAPASASTWIVTLTASKTTLWPTQNTTLTATANANVGPTPYYLRIYDGTANAFVATCGTGTTCSATVTQPTPTTHTYWAVVGDDAATLDLSAEQGSSGFVPVTWQGVSVALNANPPTVAIGGSSTLTATTSADIGPSPYDTFIFDTTTGTAVTACGSGTSCTGTVSLAGGITHRYVAYVAMYGTSFPPPGVVATSNASFVTWANTGYTVSLNTPPASTNTPITLTATANATIGVYYLEIFDENGTLLKICNSGVSCSVSYLPSPSGSFMVAFVTSYSTSLPPVGAQASSNVVHSASYVS